MSSQVQDAVASLERLDPLERVTAAGRLIEEYRQAMAVVAQVRSEAVAELRASGMSLADVARHLNVTRQQVHRIQQAAGNEREGAPT